MEEYEIILEMVNQLDEIEQDLFCSGLRSAPEYVFRSLSDLAKTAESYGMGNYKQYISSLLTSLKQNQHIIYKNDTAVMETYVKLYHFNRLLKKRLIKDKLQHEML